MILMAACTATDQRSKKSYLESTPGQQKKASCEAGSYSACLSLSFGLSEIYSSQNDLQMAVIYADMVCNADKDVYMATYMGCSASRRIKNGRQFRDQALSFGECVTPVNPPKPTPENWIQMYKTVECN